MNTLENISDTMHLINSGSKANMIYIVTKEFKKEPIIEEFREGVYFGKEGLEELEWLYFAVSKSDAEVALVNIPKHLKDK